MNTVPNMAVVSSHILQRSNSPLPIEVTANTIVSELIKRTNELTEVNGISNRSAAVEPSVSGPTRLRSKRYVDISDANNKQSEPRKAHIVIFSLLSPVVRGGTS